MAHAQLGKGVLSSPSPTTPTGQWHPWLGGRAGWPSADLPERAGPRLNGQLGGHYSGVSGKGGKKATEVQASVRVCNTTG